MSTGRGGGRGGFGSGLIAQILQLPNSLGLVWPAATGAKYYWVMRRRGVGREWMMASGLLLNTTWVEQSLPDGASCDFAVWAMIGSAATQITGVMTGAQVPRTWLSPLIITAAGNYSGNYRSTDPAVDAITVNAGISGQVIIQNYRVRGRRHGIKLGQGSDHYIRNGVGWADHPGVANSSNGSFIQASAPPLGLTVEHNQWENWAMGVYVDGQSTTTCQRLVVRGNRSLNGQSSRTNATGYDQVKQLEGHVVQANHVFKCAELDIERNEAVQEFGVGLVNDAVNIYVSSGLSTRPYRVRNNLVYGLYPYIANGASPARDNSGCGFIVDGDGAALADPTNFGFGVVQYNTAIACSNAGFAVAAGQNQDFSYNRSYTCGYTPDGTTMIYATNVGMYMQPQYSYAAGNFDNNSVHDNIANHTERPYSRNQGGGGTYNNAFDFGAAGTHGNTASNNTADYSGSSDRDREILEYMNWWTATSQSGVVLGAQTVP